MMLLRTQRLAARVLLRCASQALPPRHPRARRHRPPAGPARVLHSAATAHGATLHRCIPDGSIVGGHGRPQPIVLETVLVDDKPLCTCTTATASEQAPPTATVPRCAQLRRLAPAPAQPATSSPPQPRWDPLRRWRSPCAELTAASTSQTTTSPTWLCSAATSTPGPCSPTPASSAASPRTP